MALTKEEIIEGNKLIAEFMGGKSDKLNKMPQNMRFDNPINGTYSFTIKELKYHFSWDWLMIVIKKIDSLQTDFTKSLNAKTSLQLLEEASKHKPIRSAFLSLKIENVWIKVVDFIKWYNTSKK